MKTKKFDTPFLILTGLLLVAGFFIFSSASMGLLAREGISYSSVTIKQFLIGFVAGGICLLVFARIPYSVWRKHALIIFIISILASIAVFVPHIGFAHGGARRWITFGSYSFQPAELLKLASVIYFAAWIASVKKGVGTFKSGLIPLIVIIGIVGALLIKQPDTGTFLVLFFSLIAMYIVGGGRFRHIMLLVALVAVACIFLAIFRPYVMDRLTTFLHPSEDSLGSGYQIQQSLIAVGSGGMFGRGFGQSIQKFNFLPEPIGDSIFAVFSEEFGFVGAVLLVALFLLFALRGYKIASAAPDVFGVTLATGLVTLIVVESFINIGALLGVLPLTGIPLTFVSQGGTALFFAIMEAGIILNISKNHKRF